jgi:hypothetical protein
MLTALCCLDRQNLQQKAEYTYTNEAGIEHRK